MPVLSVDHVVGTNVKRIREAGDLSQVDLAARMTTAGSPWSTSTVSLIESGKRKVSLSELADLAAVMGVRPADLLNRAGLNVVGTASDRVRILGGGDAPEWDSPNIPAMPEADQVAHERQARRVLMRIVNAINWDTVPDYTDATPEDRLELIRDTIADLYGEPDVLALREYLARGSADAESFVTSVSAGPDDWARYRTAATKQITNQVAEDLAY